MDAVELLNALATLFCGTLFAARPAALLYPAFLPLRALGPAWCWATVFIGLGCAGIWSLGLDTKFRRQVNLLIFVWWLFIWTLIILFHWDAPPVVTSGMQWLSAAWVYLRRRIK